MYDSLSSIHIRWADDDGDAEAELKNEIALLKLMAEKVVSQDLILEKGNNLALLQSWPEFVVSFNCSN